MANERNTLTDDELIADFVRGDALAFEELVLRYKNSLYQYILVMTGDEGAAGDLFQEVFLSVYKNAQKYQAQGKFKAWLFRLGRNRVLNYFRDKDPLFSLDQTDEDGKEPLHEILPSGEELPLETLERAELAKEIRKATQALRNFIANIAGIDVGENKGISIPSHRRAGSLQLADFRSHCSIKLQRTDAKVKFVVTTDNVHGYENFSFSPRSWVVKRVPSQSYILPQTTGDYDGEDALYFTDMVRPFETITRNETNPKLYTGGSFVFYMPENRKSPKKEITRSGSESDAELYALREKSDGKDDKGDKKFIYASDNSTYVEITGLLSYIDNEKNTNADVRFIVHLGNPEEKKEKKRIEKVSLKYIVLKRQ